MAHVADLGARDEDGALVGRPMIDAAWQGKRLRAVGSGFVARPEQETDQEFFVATLCHTLGDAWFQEQTSVGESDRHPLARWLWSWDEIRRSNGEAGLDRKEEVDGKYSTAATGNLNSLITLAYDVYALRHAMALAVDDSIVKRLANREQFQGARYELAAAAIMVRAGYAIEWLTDTSRKLPEFIARRGASELVVEAKSRTRPGVLGQPGDRPEGDELQADVSRLLRRALAKDTGGRALVVFLDTNLPPSGAAPTEESLRRLHDGAMAWRGAATTADPDPFSLVVLTNFSWHWNGSERAKGAERVMVIPNYPTIPLAPDDLASIVEAVDQYGLPPESR